MDPNSRSLSATAVRRETERRVKGGCTAIHSTLWVGLAAYFLAIAVALGAPFARKFTYQQPKGPIVELWGQGDEFYSVFETLDGYTVVFNPATKAYHYATLAADGSDLVPIDLKVGQGEPANCGLARHLRLSSEAVKTKAEPLRREYEETSGIKERWQELRAAQHQAESARRPKSPTALSSEGAPCFTTGVKVGLTLLVDFDDAPAAIPREEVVAFLNGDNYSNYGCYGSVKQYYADNSNGRLLFTNVVTPYVRIPTSLHPRSYYADVSRDCLDVGRELLRDAINILKSQPNYASEILPVLGSVTFDPLYPGASNGVVVSMNMFVSGPNSGVWRKGLWGGAPYGGWADYGGTPEVSSHQWVDGFQYAVMENDLSLYVFCHENGHSMCHFPDLYDYDFDSMGGAGAYCIMGIRQSDDNPPQFCAFLKAAAGWASITDLDATSVLTARLGVGSGQSPNQIYRYRRPGADTEYFLIENRQQRGHDASIPGSGIAIWHIDELGNRDNQSILANSAHANFQVTLEQADNQWHLQRYVNPGDPNDLFYRDCQGAYSGYFSDSTQPSAAWWDGTPSGLSLFRFSPSAETMTFAVGPLPAIPEIACDPADRTAFTGGTAEFAVRAYASLPLSYQWHQGGNQIPGATRATLILSNITTSLASLSVVVSSAQGLVTSALAGLTVMSTVPSIVAWGNRDYGQCDVPADLTSAVTVAGGRFFSLALLSDGTVRAWGDNSKGQCNVPGDLQQVVKVAAGAYFSMALRSNGTVIAWGANDQGQTNLPTGLRDVIAIAAGQYHALALRNDGSVAAWGYDADGETTVPAGLSDATAISAGYQHCLALKRNGEVVGWGRGDGGERVPAGLSNVVSIVAGAGASLALKRDGTVMAWGANAYGQMDVPAGLSSVVAITGYFHFMALRADGTVVAWGGTGDQNFGQADLPPGLSNVVAIASNGRHSLALLRAPGNDAVRLLEPLRVEGAFRLKVRTVPGRNYFPEYKDALQPGGWMSLPPIGGDGQISVIIDPAANATQRFYRVRVE